MVEISFSHRQEIFYALDSGGSGPVLVLLHGFLEDRHMWAPLSPALQKHWRVIRLDLPGHGKAPSLGYQHSMEDMAELVQALLDQHGITAATLAGHSMGGYVALAFVERYPARLNGLILLNSSPWPDTPERRKSRDRAIALVKRNPSSYLRQAIPLLFAPESRKEKAPEVQAAISEAQKMNTQGIIAALAGMKIRPDREAVLRRLPCPVLIAAAQADPILNFDALQTLAREVKAQWLPLPHGHMSHVEAPEALKKGLLAFAQGRSPSQRTS